MENVLAILTLYHTVESPEAAALISSLRDMIRRQAAEIETLQTLANRPTEPQENPETVALVNSLREQLQKQTGELQGLQNKLADVMRAHEDEVNCPLDTLKQIMDYL